MCWSYFHYVSYGFSHSHSVSKNLHFLKDSKLGTFRPHALIFNLIQDIDLFKFSSCRECIVPFYHKTLMIFIIFVTKSQKVAFFPHNRYTSLFQKCIIVYHQNTHIHASFSTLDAIILKIMG